MAWSIFTQGGGQGVALGWAQDLLTEIGAPLSAGNEQFVYDWELSEGGGGRYNPLNQGPDPGHPELTTTGSQYGGGAADYASWQAGLQGAKDYLAMPNYQAIATDLQANDPTDARAALIASPWAASHYGWGRNFATAPPPAQAQALPPLDSTSLTGVHVGTGIGPNGPGGFIGSLGKGVAKDVATVGAYLLALATGGALIVAGVYRTAHPGATFRQSVTNALPAAALAAA